MHFFHQNVPVSSTSPPEEILATLTGPISIWQIAVITVSIITRLIHGLDALSIHYSLPRTLNFTCADGNGSKCFSANGHKCTNFTFFKSDDVHTFTENLNLVCDKEFYLQWIKACYMLGIVVGYIVSAGAIQKFGIQSSCIIFIFLQSASGLLLLTIETVEILIGYLFIHGLFSCIQNLAPFLAVCDNVGNKWRTFALGIICLPFPIVLTCFPYFFLIFTDAKQAVGTVAILPLITLVPILYYKESPNYICILKDFHKAEETLREIAATNNCPLSPTAKIRPSRLLLEAQSPKRHTFCDLWEPATTRKAYLALSCIWFLNGLCKQQLITHSYFGWTDITIYGGCAIIGCVLAIVMCHLVSHKLIIAVFSLLRCFLTASKFLFAAFLYDKTIFEFFIVKMMSEVMDWVVITTLINLTPRMFPTEKRSICFGFCIALNKVGIFLANFMGSYTFKMMWFIIGVLLILMGLVTVVCCFWLWNVHKRELPDFLIDCEQFEEFYKPTRFYVITGEQTSQAEIEIMVVHLNDIEVIPKKNILKLFKDNKRK